jgi:hypothetical protein
MGYPFTLPLKIADRAEVKSTTATFFEANLDVAGGNSGSPVIDRDNLKVVGILVRGVPDPVTDLDQGCYRSARYRDADGYLTDFPQATHVAMLPVVESCVGRTGCLTVAATASCLTSSVLDLHRPFCRECYPERGPVRKVRRKVEKALRLLAKGDAALDFDLRKAGKALQQSLRQLERTASQLEQMSATGRVSVPCHGALRSVIHQALEGVRFDLALLALLR